MNAMKRMKYFYEHVVSENLIDEFPQYIAEDCMVRVGEQQFTIGYEGMKQHLLDVRKTYPDLAMKIIRQYSYRGTIVSEFVMEGTHLGEWLGMKPTSKKITMNGVDIDRVVRGKIVEHGGAVGTFEALFEAGIIKPA